MFNDDNMHSAILSWKDKGSSPCPPPPPHLCAHPLREDRKRIIGWAQGLHTVNIASRSKAQHDCANTIRFEMKNHLAHIRRKPVELFKNKSALDLQMQEYIWKINL